MRNDAVEDDADGNLRYMMTQLLVVLLGYSTWETLVVSSDFTDDVDPQCGWWFGTFSIFAYAGNNHPN